LPLRSFTPDRAVQICRFTRRGSQFRKRSILIEAIGAGGGQGSPFGNEGRGSRTAANVSVAPGRLLTVRVGGRGQAGAAGSTPAGGFNGGGTTGDGGGGYFGGGGEGGGTPGGGAAAGRRSLRPARPGLCFSKVSAPLFGHYFLVIA
jgi:hypothetical protein